MNGTNRGAIRAYAAFSNDLIDLIVKDYPLDLFEDPFPILEAQPDPVWAGHPVWSRNAVKLMSALLPVVEGRFDCNPYVHGSPPYKELTLAQARSPTTTPMFCPLPAVIDQKPERDDQRGDGDGVQLDLHHPHHYQRGEHGQRHDHADDEARPDPEE